MAAASGAAAAAAGAASAATSFATTFWSFPSQFVVYGVRLPMPTLRGAQLYFGFVAVLFVLTKLLPGKQQQGEPLPPDYKKRLMYKINAFATLCVASAVLYALWSHGVYEPAEFITEYWSIVVVALLWSAFLTVAHYVSARVRGVAETSGNLLVDLWCGVELNPRLFGVDLKMFAYRPGMMGYLLINLAALHRHYQLHGTISDAMILFQFFSGYYCLDFFWFEQVVLPIYDIIEERWGFMLIFGDYVWITFVFSMNSLLLIDDTKVVPWWFIGVCCALFVVGFIVFRMTNLQKYRIKQDRNALIWGKPAEFVDNRLMVSGMWGLLRKVNYTGDLLIAYAFALPVWYSSSLWAFVYPAYLTILLLHRCHRDEHRCAAKYGATWTKYCERVPYRMIPFVY